MKNLKRMLSFLVLIAMLGATCIMAFANPDEAGTEAETHDADAEKAVNLVLGLNLFEKNADGSFNLDRTVTRGEFAAVVCRSLGLKDMEKTKTEFADVPVDRPDSGYIQAAWQMGIINGDTSTTFSPDSFITGEQAVKMMVTALGYRPIAEERGGYPIGYMTVAAQEGVVKGINMKTGDYIKSGDLVNLVYNALNVPLVEQTGFGQVVEYTKMDGKNGNDLKTLITEKLQDAVTALEESTKNKE